MDYDGRRLIGVRYWLAANGRLAQAESLYPGVQAEASPHRLIITPNRTHSPANNGLDTYSHVIPALEEELADTVAELVDEERG